MGMHMSRKHEIPGTDICIKYNETFQTRNILGIHFDLFNSDEKLMFNIVEHSLMEEVICRDFLCK